MALINAAPQKDSRRERCKHQATIIFNRSLRKKLSNTRLCVVRQRDTLQVQI